MTLKDLMPWGKGRDLIDSVERAFDEPWEATTARLFGSEWLPRVQVQENEKEVLVSVSLPGLKKDDLHVSVTADSLALRGVRRLETEESFYRSLTLPASVRPEDAKARFKDGQLSITLPKAKHSQVKRVAIE